MPSKLDGGDGGAVGADRARSKAGCRRAASSLARRRLGSGPDPPRRHLWPPRWCRQPLRPRRRRTPRTDGCRRPCRRRCRPRSARSRRAPSALKLPSTVAGTNAPSASGPPSRLQLPGAAADHDSMAPSTLRPSRRPSGRKCRSAVPARSAPSRLADVPVDSDSTWTLWSAPEAASWSPFGVEGQWGTDVGIEPETGSSCQPSPARSHTRRLSSSSSMAQLGAVGAERHLLGGHGLELRGGEVGAGCAVPDGRADRDAASSSKSRAAISPGDPPKVKPSAVVPSGVGSSSSGSPLAARSHTRMAGSTLTTATGGRSRLASTDHHRGRRRWPAAPLLRHHVDQLDQAPLRPSAPATRRRG